jgi:glutamine amidotransferase
MSVKLKISVIDYGMGNLKSVFNSLRYIGYTNLFLTDSIRQISNSDMLIIPGVGAFNDAMDNLRSRKLIEALNKHALQDKKPVIGICLGMQLFVEHSSEGMGGKGLGWIQGKVKKFKLPKEQRVPHMGWNDISIRSQHELFKDVPSDNNFYFVHSYFVECEEKYVVAKCKYGVEFNAAISKENLIAFQFHPEKSHKNGLKLLSNTINHLSSQFL